MLEMLLLGLRYFLTLLFGVAVSAAFLDVAPTRRNIIILGAFAVLDFGVQSSLYLLQTLTLMFSLYPFVAHIPLMLLLILAFKARPVSAILSVLTGYLCCQVSNWASTIPQTFQCANWIVDLTYITVLITMFPLVLRFAAAPIARLLAKPSSELVSFAIVPVAYYIFDYTSTVYTKLLYAGNYTAVEFPPFLLCVSYLIFCTIYFKQYEEKQEAENRHRFIKLKQEQSEKEIASIRRNEQAIALLRHDMRHFLNTISERIQNGETDKAQEYIHEIIASADKTARKKYSTNETINMILSSYESVMTENGIQFQCSIRVPRELPVSDVDLTSILSNAMENAVHATASIQDPARRSIEFAMNEAGGKLLISLENTCESVPRFTNGLPVTSKPGHGFGTQSIDYTVRKLNGNCHFSASAGKFILQIVL